MLTYESLVEQAGTRNMPSTKIRGILREYLQILMLKQLYSNKSGKKLYFTGGTYLRLVHNLKRFSEDLDFNTDKMHKNEFEYCVEQVAAGLKKTGIRCNVTFNHWDSLYVSNFIFPEIEKNYNVISKYSKKEGISIKFETNNPRWKIKSELQMVTGFGELYPVVCTEIGSLFADKIDAVSRKNRGRHIYDIIFLLANKHPINRTVLKALKITGEPFDTILKSIKRIPKNELKKQAEILKPFLFEESESELVANAHQVVPQLITKYIK